MGVERTQSRQCSSVRIITGTLGLIYMMNEKCDQPDLVRPCTKCLGLFLRSASRRTHNPPYDDNNCIRRQCCLHSTGWLWWILDKGRACKVEVPSSVFTVYVCLPKKRYMGRALNLSFISRPFESVLYLYTY